ncbi:hypothetical protein [Iamia sp.]|uniref:restriction system modified-DNA reader domain-containing protein n=1 Tax=Iamia sp. TaxID=2722710 RepID=UPI002C1C77E7|nr:hypothetical protein [Iamia sp.]HXH56726.1 hypothetical protein [Iamia sp.]
MPLFEVSDESLVPFRSVKPGADLYEKEIEDLVWGDLEAFTGESLFPIARQPLIGGGGRPDVVALDESGRVVVVEVKRDVDRSQLAQCLEYAGWARTTNLDEIASLYHRGPSSFFANWQEFTDSSTPVVINHQPRIVLVARDFQGRTRSALEFLAENGVPVSVIPVAIYEDEAGRRFLDIEAEHDPVLGPTAGASSRSKTPAQITFKGRRVTMVDLLDAGFVQAGDDLVFPRPRLGEKYHARLEANGTIVLPDGSVCTSPSQAAMKVADLASYDGWHGWRVPRLDGAKLDELRQQLVTAETTSSDALAEETTEEA